MTQDNVLVVGAGPVGLTIALGLARAGVGVTVMERGSTLNASPRAAVYQWCVLDYLAELGVLEDAEAHGVRGRGLGMRRFDTGQRIRRSASILEGYVPHPYTIHLGQDKLGEIVLAHLQRYPHASVMWNIEVTGLRQDPDGVTVHTTSSGEPGELRGGWVIGADGARSVVRHALGLAFDGLTWPERFVATNIRYDFPAHGFDDGNFVADQRMGAVVVVLNREGLWRCTYQEDANLPVETIPDRMASFFEAFLPGTKDFELVEWSPYQMHQRSASRYRVGRVVLAGDAAHATNPTGGLGLTSGLFDAQALTGALAAVIHGETGDDVLDRYDEVRRRAFLEIASPAATEYKRLVFGTDPAGLDAIFAAMAAEDEAAQRANMLAVDRLRTPSLLTPNTVTEAPSPARNP
jgi:3-(3-hydroxy-phenyl)propionate hydroxylase/6-hydroxy-3-succinoylpyridine 3-monooxygenase